MPQSLPSAGELSALAQDFLDRAVPCSAAANWYEDFVLPQILSIMFAELVIVGGSCNGEQHGSMVWISMDNGVAACNLLEMYQPLLDGLVSRLHGAIVKPV